LVLVLVLIGFGLVGFGFWSCFGLVLVLVWFGFVI